MMNVFFASLLDVPQRDELLACCPDCVEAAGLVDLNALARNPVERVRVLGEVSHLLEDAEVTALASALAAATVTAARLIHKVAERMNEEPDHADQ